MRGSKSPECPAPSAKWGIFAYDRPANRVNRDKNLGSQASRGGPVAGASLADLFDRLETAERALEEAIEKLDRLVDRTDEKSAGSG